MSRREFFAGFGMIAAAWIIALASALAGHGGRGEVCAQDRVPLKPVYAVTVAFADGTRLRFCNVRCAAAFLGATDRAVDRITVTDEATGAPLPARDAFYVESEVFTHRESANRIHVFASLADARDHAAQYDGRIVPCPF